MENAVIQHPIVNTDGRHITIGEDGQVKNAPDPVAEATKSNWSDTTYLYECLENFLKAIQLKAKKDYQYADEEAFKKAGSPVWSINDNFFGWVKDQEDQLQFRLDELHRKYQEGAYSDKNLLHLLDEGAIDNPHPFLARQMNVEDFEQYEFIIRKSIEAVEKFRKGVYSIDDVRRGQRNAT